MCRIAIVLWAWALAGAWGQDVPAVRAARHLGGRVLSGNTSAANALDTARRQHAAMAALPRAANLSAAWTPVGPEQVASQYFGAITGRVTSLALDPADATGNTLYVGTTGGGVWKSTNAAGPVGAVTFAPLTDTLPVFDASAATAATPSLSIGALAVANGVVLAGTGDTNDATDSYYGAGVLRSDDGGLTWSLVQQTTDGASNRRSFFGVGFSGIAFSTANPALAVAAVSHAAEGDLVNAPNGQAAAVGLYYSPDAGLTWRTATVLDGSQVEQGAGYSGGNSATAVVWNALRQKFYAAVQFHGYYESADGATWTRLAHQPGAGLTTTACPVATATIATTACPIFRGALAVQPVSGDMFALTVDAANRDAGLVQDVCGASGTGCGNAVLFGATLNGAPLEAGAGSTVIAQGDYNLTLAAAPAGADTLLYAGTIDLYRCSVAAGCSLRNTTNAQNGCSNRAGVFPAQHALAVAGTTVFVGNDGGLWRSTDGVNETGAACSLGDATHFQNLNGALGSLAEVVGFAQDPALPGTLLAGLGAEGTAGTGTATGAWTQLTTGEGGTVAIDAANPLNWYVSNGAGVSIARCAKGSACGAADFAGTIGAAQTANDVAAIHAPWLLDPAMATNMIVGTCRAWRGPVAGGALWSGSNAISAPFATPTTTACGATAPVVRSLAAGGAAVGAGSTVMYAGLAGALDGGGTLGGHVFVTTAANVANNATAWTDAAKAPVTNDVADAGVFNPGGFDVSSVVVDAHDPSGRTVYATVMGFAGNGTAAPHVYRSVDAGGHWLNVSSNLPNAPANGLVVDPNDANTVYVALDTGVYVATAVTTCATTNCWSVYGAALPNAPVVALAAAAGMPTGDGRLGELRAATYGRGIWQLPLVTAISPAAPVIAISPTSVTYSAQAVGTQSAAQTVSVTNTGNAPLTVSSVVTSGDFVATNNCTGAAIASGAGCSVQVTFLPTATGARTGVLTVYGNAAGGQGTAALTGVGTAAAAIVLTPGSLTFPATTVGATSAVENITVANTGGTSAALQTPTTTGDFRITANSCGASLASQVSCTVSIVFAPTTNGSRNGVFSITDDAGTQVASLVGVGTAPATDSLTPLALSFTAQQLTTASAGQVVTLTNAGDVALTLISAQITSGDFTVTSACGVSLNAHASCTFAVGFVPKSVGSQTGVLTVADQFRSQTVSLAGVGVAPPGVSLSPTNGLSFPGVGVGLTGAAQTVTLTNNGGLPLVIGSVVAAGDFSLVPGQNTCVGSIAPSGVCTVAVVFQPTAVGARNSSLIVVDNAGSSPQAIALSGVGVDFSLGVSGPATQTIASGQTATFGLLLGSNAGLTGSVPFTCSGLPAHASCTVNPGAGTLGGSQVVTVTVATGLATASVTPPVRPWEFGVMVAVLLPCVFWRRRRVFVVMVGCLLVGCSAGRTVPGSGGAGGGTTYTTPSGTYTVLVAGTSAGLVRSVSVLVVVQ